MSCHGGKDELLKAAAAAGKSETLEQYAKDYPLAPMTSRKACARPSALARWPPHAAHGDDPVGLGLLRLWPDLHHRISMARAAPSAMCRSIPKSLVTGKLFEDIREAVFTLAKPEDYDTIVITNLCVPTASGVPLQLLPKEINGVRIVGIDVPGFGVPTHAEAKDVLVRRHAEIRRQRNPPGPGAAPRTADGVRCRPSRCSAKCSRPIPWASAGCWSRWALPRVRSFPRANGANCSRRFDCAAVAAIHPFYTASIREFETAGRTVVGSAPVGHDGTADWLANIGKACGIAADKIAAAQNAILPAIKGALAAKPIKGRITVSGYEGSELLVARLLIESGADVPYVGTACPRTRWSDADREWLEAKGVTIQFRASLENDSPPCWTIARISPSAPRRWCRRPSPCRSRRFISPT